MDPNPIKHAGVLMKRVRSEVEPALFAAEFVFEGRNKPVRGAPGSEHLWLDYGRPGMLFRLRFEPCNAQLIAETIDEKCAYCSAVKTDLCHMDKPPTTAELLTRINDFNVAVIEFIGSLPPVPKPPSTSG